MPSNLMNKSISTAYMTADTKLPPYLPYPVFLLDMKISMTAKAVYALLIHRSNLSQTNHWEDELGRVFIIYPIDAIAADMHKGRTTIKKAIRKLEDSDLLERHRQSTGKSNLLYVKVPKQSGPDPPHESSGSSDLTGRKQTLSTVRKQTLARSGNGPPDSRFPGHDTAAFPAASKKKELTDHNNKMDSETCSAYGRFGNIILSENEYHALASDFADELPRYIEELSCYLAASGRTYKNYEAGIRSWALRDHSKKKTVEPDKYDYSEEDSLCV